MELVHPRQLSSSASSASCPQGASARAGAASLLAPDADLFLGYNDGRGDGDNERAGIDASGDWLLPGGDRVSPQDGDSDLVRLLDTGALELELELLDVLTATTDNDVSDDASTSSSSGGSSYGNGAAGGSGSETPVGLQSAPRKRTYEMRKAEMDALAQQAARLEDTLDRLRRTAGMPDKQTLAQQRIEAILLREMARNQQYAIAELQARLARDTSEHTLPPTSRAVHLGADPQQRRSLLLALRPLELRDARRFVAHRAQFHAPTARFSESSRWQSDDGDTFAAALDVVPLPRAASVRQVLDALLAGWRGLEARGDTGRGGRGGHGDGGCGSRLSDDDDRSRLNDDDGSGRGASNAEAAQLRLVSASASHGATVEANCVLFSEYRAGCGRGDGAKVGEDAARDAARDATGDASEDARAQRARRGEEAVLASDFVDSDALFPYATDTRVRKDVTSVATVRWCSPDAASRPIVVLTLWVQSRLHSGSGGAAAALSDEQLEALVEESPEPVVEALLAAATAVGCGDDERSGGADAATPAATAAAATTTARAATKA